MAKQKFKFKTTNVEENEINTEVGEVKKVGEDIPEIMNQLKSSKKGNIGNMKVVPRHKLRVNKKNSGYSLTGIERLKESILQYALQQDICAVYVTNEDMYVIETGHRRKQAIDELIEEFQEYPEDSTDERYLNYVKNVKQYEYGYVCKITGKIAEDVEYDLEDENNLAEASEETIRSEIRLHITNIEVRNETNAEHAANVERLAALYNELNRRSPYSERINVNKTIGEQLGISGRQVASYKNITKLIPELKEEFDKNKITVEQGSSYSKLTEDEQMQIVELLQSGRKVNDKEIKHVLELNKQLVQQLKEKENRLAEMSKQKSENIKDDMQEEKVRELEKEIKRLKSHKENIATVPEDENTKKLIEIEMQFKAYYEQSEKTLKKLIELYKRYIVMYNKDAPEYISSVEECYNMMQKLQMMFQ